MKWSFDTLRHALQCTRRAGPALAAPALLALVVGCGSNPYQIKWSPFADTARLYSLARPEVNLPSGFSFAAFSSRPSGQTVVVEAPGSTGAWDIALDTEGGNLVFVLPGTFGITSRARITALPGMTFDDVTEAPADTAAYNAKAPVAVSTGTTYVVQTGSRPGTFGGTCVYYGKLEPLDVNVEQGTLRFIYDTSPVCNDRNLAGTQ